MPGYQLADAAVGQVLLCGLFDPDFKPALGEGLNQLLFSPRHYPHAYVHELSTLARPADGAWGLAPIVVPAAAGIPAVVGLELFYPCFGAARHMAPYYT